MPCCNLSVSGGVARAGAATAGWFGAGVPDAVPPGAASSSGSPSSAASTVREQRLKPAGLSRSRSFISKPFAFGTSLLVEMFTHWLSLAPSTEARPKRSVVRSRSIFAADACLRSSAITLRGRMVRCSSRMAFLSLVKATAQLTGFCLDVFSNGRMAAAGMMASAPAWALSASLG